MEDPEDARLVALVREGDRAAFGSLVARHERALLAVASAYFASVADAEDAVQEAFLKAFRSLGQLEDDSRFAGWLSRITINTCVDILRKRGDVISLTAFSTSVQCLPRVGEAQPGPTTEARKIEQADLLKAAIGRLPEDQRVVLMLRYTEDMSYVQMARYLDVPPSTVRGRLHNAKLALKRALRGLDPNAKPQDWARQWGARE